MKKNIRIQLFDEQGMVSDRMVSQDLELKSGPKETHDGPMRIEFSIFESADVDNMVTYLQKLAGQVPLQSTIKPRGRQKGDFDNDTSFAPDKEAMITELIQANNDNQDKFIKSLRELSFFFVESGYLKHIIPESYQIKKVHLESYQWLIRRTKEAKDPKNDKYDPQILIGIKIMDDRSDKVLVYLHGEFKERITIQVPEKKAITAKKTNLIKYPHYMVEEERFKWGTEHRLLFNTPERKASKFYKRWYKDVTVGDELKIEDIESRLP